MKRLVLIFSLMCTVCSMLQSCTTTTYASTQCNDMYEVTTETTVSSDITYTTIITYGTPYYYNNVISHYVYRGCYYYPYLWDGVWYFHVYNTARPYGFVYRPSLHHRPVYCLGDIHRHHSINYGSRHIDHYRNSSYYVRTRQPYNHNNQSYHGNSSRPTYRQSTSSTHPNINNRPNVNNRPATRPTTPPTINRNNFNRSGTTFNRGTYQSTPNMRSSSRSGTYRR